MKATATIEVYDAEGARCGHMILEYENNPRATTHYVKVTIGGGVYLVETVEFLEAIKAVL